MANARILDVTDTALLVATGRVHETERPDALFRDPLAAKLIGERGKAMAKKMGWVSGLDWTMSMRTIIIDEFVMRAIAEGCDTVVNLGCGLDTRPYRMDLPETLRWVEVDFPKIISYKESILVDDKPRCQLERHAVDLSVAADRRALLKTLATQGQKILVITEGVVPYLTNQDAAALAEELHAEKAFKWWVVDYFSDDVMKRMQSRRIKKRMGTARLQFMPGNWTEFFASRGWEKREMRYLADEGERRGRKFPTPTWMSLLFMLMPARKMEKMMKSTGYALFEAKH